MTTTSDWTPISEDTDPVRPGWAPDWDGSDTPIPPASITIRAFRRWAGPTWDLYPESGRWPQCSCCGEPMPCRAELEDREVGKQLDVVEKLASRMPGCCWGCGEPITSRQKAVTYPGDNLDLPGGQPVRFHTRRDCHWMAAQYELRWIAADPRNERVLTWPECGGILVVHRDGSSECMSGPGPFGGVRTGEPNCEGHLTHDHGATTACYVAGDWFAVHDWPGCPRGCAVEGHPGARPARRPERRQQDSLLGGGA